MSSGEGQRATKIALAALGVATAAMGLAGYCIAHNASGAVIGAAPGAAALSAALHWRA